MNIIYPKSSDVDQFLVDVRDGYYSLNPKELDDLTDKVMYFPKSILSDNGKILSFEEACKHFKTNGLKKIRAYLKQLKITLAKFEFLHKVHQDFSHIDKFLKAFKQSKHCYNRVIAVEDSKIVNSDFYCYFSQDIHVKVNKTPKILGIDQQILEIVDKKTGPIKALELEL